MAAHTKIKRIATISHLLVLAGAAAIIITASVDAFSSMSFEASTGSQHLQVGICALIFVDLIIEFMAADSRSRYALVHWPFLLLCIPWFKLLTCIGVHPSGVVTLVLNLIPICRGIFILASLLMALRYSPTDSLFVAYIALMAGIVYFSSLIFYVAEHAVNNSVQNFLYAIYWAVLSLTTTGSEILPATLIGQAVAVVLSASGLIMFPVFTVYVASRFNGQ